MAVDCAQVHTPAAALAVQLQATHHTTAARTSSVKQAKFVADCSFLSAYHVACGVHDIKDLVCRVSFWLGGGK